MKKIKHLVLGIVVIALLAAALLVADLYRFAHQPSGTNPAECIVDIAARQPFGGLATQLETAGVITSATRFKLLARLKNDDKRLRAGEFAFSTTMTPLQVLETLVNGKVYLHRFTVPEGYTIQQIADALSRSGLADPKQFTTLTTDHQVIRSFGLDVATLEGYLFPDTYFFPKSTPPLTIITQMVRRFQEHVTQPWRTRAQELAMSIHQVVTLASIIEKETADGPERPMVSSVFHNRMKLKMRLESDPTVIYGIKAFDGNITREHLTAPTAYNTYVIEGLPPGPIANPGRAALEAALYPAQTHYLYFVSKNDTTHYFSSTIKEHNQAVRKYQLNRRKTTH